MVVSNAAATATSNQKKGLTLSNGYLVIAYTETTTNGKFKYSTDGGQTWIDYAADVAGWNNGSIAAYVDSGGVERIVATWRQSGTGGSRIDGHVYVMVGTLNAGRTTITWGSPVDPASGVSTYNYPDIVAHAEGTGGRAHVVLSNPTAITAYCLITIDSSGTPSAGTLTSIGGSYSTGLNTWTSIALNTSTKDLYAVWSSGTTGIGRGIRYRKAVYSAGSWTWNAERELDNTCYLNDPTPGVSVSWLKAVVDLSNSEVLIVGACYTGTAYKFMLWRRDLADTTTTTQTFTTDAAASGIGVFSGTFEIDTSSGDAYIVGRPNSTTNLIRYYKWTRSGASLGSAQDIEVPGNSAEPGLNAWFSGSTVRFVYTTGNNSPFAVKYDQLALNVAPNIPTALQRTDVSNTTTTPSFSAAMSDPNVGQNVKVRFEIWNRARSVQTGSVDSGFSAAPATVTATYSSALPVGQYSLRAFAIDDAALQSGYTAWVDFDVTQYVTKDRTYLWNTRQYSTHDATILWNTLANNAKDLTLVWGVRINASPKDLTLLWKVDPVWTKVNPDDDSPAQPWTLVPT